MNDVIMENFAFKMNYAEILMYKRRSLMSHTHLGKWHPNSIHLLSHDSLRSVN